MIALLLGRFHALNRAHAELVASLAQKAELARIVCVQALFVAAGYAPAADERAGSTPHEEHGARTADGWRAALERANFSVLAIRSYVNEWIRDHRYRDHVTLTELDGRAFWPPTNAVAVGEPR